MTIVSGLRIIDSNAQTGITWWNWTNIHYQNIKKTQTLKLPPKLGGGSCRNILTFFLLQKGEYMKQNYHMNANTNSHYNVGDLDKFSLSKYKRRSLFFNKIRVKRDKCWI
jgi:hypothetical protein